MHTSNFRKVKRVEDVVRIFAKVRTEVPSKLLLIGDGPERQKIIDEMLVIARQDAPWIWGFHPKQYSLFHAWYKNIKPNLMANNGLKYTRIDAGLRAKRQREWNKPMLWPLGLLVGVLVAGLVPAVAVYRRKERQAAIPDRARRD